MKITIYGIFATIIVASIAVFMLIAGTDSGGEVKTYDDCAIVAVGKATIYYEPKVSSIVGVIPMGEELKVIKASGDWYLVNGHGIDSSWRKARMSGWVDSSQLAPCQ